MKYLQTAKNLRHSTGVNPNAEIYTKALCSQKMPLQLQRGKRDYRIKSKWRITVNDSLLPKTKVRCFTAKVKGSPSPVNETKSPTAGCGNPATDGTSALNDCLSLTNSLASSVNSNEKVSDGIISNFSVSGCVKSYQCNSGELETPLQSAKNRYTVPNAETTAGGIGLPVGDSVELSGCNLAAFFAPKPLFGRARWGAARLARVASSRPTHLVPSTRLVSDGRFVKRTERRHAMAINKTYAQGQEQTQSHYFENVSIRPLERLAHLIHEHGDNLSDNDLSGFITNLQCEVYQTRDVVSLLCDVYQDAPCLDYGKKIDEFELRSSYRELLNALNVAIDQLSKLSDLGLVCAYASDQIYHRLSALNGGDL
jgi:hypothetical protein